MLAEGRPLAAALRLAVAAGTLAVQGRGTVDSYASRAEVLAAASPASAVEPRPAVRPTPEAEEPATP
jgi:ribokinase